MVFICDVVQLKTTACRATDMKKISLILFFNLTMHIFMFHARLVRTFPVFYRDPRFIA